MLHHLPLRGNPTTHVSSNCAAFFFEEFASGAIFSVLPALGLGGAEIFGTDGLGIFSPGLAVRTGASITRSCKFIASGEGVVSTCCFIVTTGSRGLAKLNLRLGSRRSKLGQIWQRGF